MFPLKVLLIQPSYRDCVQTLFSIYNTEEGIGFKPPIGLLYIATAIREMTNHDVKILDCQIEDVHHENILNFVKDSYDVIGISAWTDFWYQALNIARKLKTHYPNTHIVIGGPHVSIFPREVLGFDFIDSIIMGDGEIPMVNLLSRIADKGVMDKEILGVYLRGHKYLDYVPYVHQDLDSLPIPDRTLLPVERYSSILSSNKFVTSMITSRGCPFKCIYCKLNFQKPVFRSAENVIREFEIIYDLGIREVEVYDDTFNWNQQRTKDICRELINRNLKLKWAIRERVSKVNEDILVDLKRAGCYRIHFGIESGSDKVLKICKKVITTDQSRFAFQLAKKYGFTILAYFMYGLPGETLEEACQTLDFSLELDPDYAEYSITIPYPGTEMYKNALAEGIIPTDYWREFAIKPSPSFKIPYVIENLISKEELIKLRDISIKKFYFRPRYILREIVKVRSWKEFSQKLNMGIGLLNILRRRLVR